MKSEILLINRPINSSFFPQENLHEQLALGLLAGNVFDWGAKEVALLMESGTGLRFEDALKFVNPRPWLVDNLGNFQLEFVSISRIINHMTCYNFVCSHWWKIY